MTAIVPSSSVSLENEAESNQTSSLESTTFMVTNQTRSNENQTQANASQPQSTASLTFFTTKQKASTITETCSIQPSTLDQTTIISTTSFTKVPFVIANLFVVVLGLLVIYLCIFHIRTFKQRRLKVNREKKDKFTLETGEAKCTATAVLYDEIEPEIKLTFVSPLKGNNEEKETKTTRNKQIIDSNINSVKREKKDKLAREIEEAKFTKAAVLYDDIEPNTEITSVSPLGETNVEQELIVDSDTNLYVDCPNNVYDKMFISRPHVNESQGNVYHTVDARNNRYSLVKPIGTETT